MQEIYACDIIAQIEDVPRMRYALMIMLRICVKDRGIWYTYAKMCKFYVV